MDDNKLNQCNTNMGTDNNTLNGDSDTSNTLNTSNNAITDKCNTDKPIKDMSKIGNGNLITFDKLTEEQQREIKRKGALASAKAKRKKKDLREIAKIMLAAEMRDIQIEDMLGDDKTLIDGDKSLAAVLTARLAIEAGKGNYKAYETLRDTAGFKPKDQREIETITD